MKIGVAVPCYVGHIVPLFNLLDSIQNQTLLPDKVVVSCSSTKISELDLYIDKIKTYSFSLQIITNEEKKNAAQNRNIAASNLADVVDYITFIDADDTMHPQRIEIILRAFEEQGSDIVLHNYYIDLSFENELFKKIDNSDISIRINSLRQHCSGCIEHIDYFKYINEGIHHSQVSVKSEIFNKVKFPEEVEFNRKEDCIFCNRVFNLQDIKNAYIANKLSYYAPSNTIF